MREESRCLIKCVGMEVDGEIHLATVITCKGDLVVML